jgi:hypothetical protein
MNPFRDMFVQYTDLRSAKQCVRLGDESQTILIHGRGTMMMKVSGKIILYDNVLHVPDLTAILLSTRVYRRSAPGCSFVADHSGCFLSYPNFEIEINDTDDCTIECHPVTDPTITPDFDSRRHVTQHSSKAAIAMNFELGFRAMQHARLSATDTTAFPDLVKPNKTHRSVPVYSVPDSGGPTVERIHTSDLKRYFGCGNTLGNWKLLENTGHGLQVVQDRDAPTTLGDFATIKRNRHGDLLDRPTTTLHTVGMDIGYGDGISPGGYKFALTLVDYCTRHVWVYGLKTKSAEHVIKAAFPTASVMILMPVLLRARSPSSFNNTESSSLPRLLTANPKTDSSSVIGAPPSAWPVPSSSMPASPNGTGSGHYGKLSCT